MCADTCSTHSGETIEPHSFHDGADSEPEFPSTRSNSPSPPPATRHPRMCSPWEAQRIESLRLFQQQALLEIARKAPVGIMAQPWAQQQPGLQTAAQSDLCQGPQLAGYTCPPSAPDSWASASNQPYNPCFPLVCMPMPLLASPQARSSTMEQCWVQDAPTAGDPWPAERRNMDTEHQEESSFSVAEGGKRQRCGPPLQTSQAVRLLESGKLSKNAWHGNAAPKECETLQAELKFGGSQRAKALRVLQQCAGKFAFDPQGCRVLQLAFEVADNSERERLVAPLRGRVIEAVVSPHANYVIQKAVSELPAARRGFIIDELRGLAAAAARHRFGCRILCRLLEHGDGHEESKHLMVALIDELLQDVSTLIRHNFGHHVIEKILEHQIAPRHAHSVAATLLSELGSLAVDRNATFIIESTLRLCSPEDQQEIVSGLIGAAENVHMLVAHQFGVHVVRALLKRGDHSSEIVRDILWQAPERLQGHKYEQELLFGTPYTPTVEP